MNLGKAIEPVTVLKTRSAQLIEETRTSGQPIVITQNGRATAVLQDVETYEQQKQSLLLLKALAQGDRELKEGLGIPHAEIRRHVEARLKNLKHG